MTRFHPVVTRLVVGRHWRFLRRSRLRWWLLLRACLDWILRILRHRHVLIWRQWRSLLRISRIQRGLRSGLIWSHWRLCSGTDLIWVLRIGLALGRGRLRSSGVCARIAGPDQVNPAIIKLWIAIRRLRVTLSPPKSEFHQTIWPMLAKSKLPLSPRSANRVLSVAICKNIPTVPRRPFLPFLPRSYRRSGRSGNPLSQLRPCPDASCHRRHSIFEHMEAVTMTKNSLLGLYVDELRDIYSAERQLTKALPKMAKAATSEELRNAFTEHLQQTRGHVERLEQIFEALGERASGKKCAGMEGLVAEGSEVMVEDFEGDVMDAALISAAQRGNTTKLRLTARSVRSPSYWANHSMPHCCAKLWTKKSRLMRS